MLYSFAKFILRNFLYIRFKVVVLGKENIPKDKGYILAANHSTVFDPIYVGCFVPQQVYFMAKAELFSNKIMAYLLKKVGVFHIKRGNGDMAQLQVGVELIKDGKVMGIFPEGTRSKTGELLKAKSGVVIIAAQSNGDILPAALKVEKRKFKRKVLYVSYGRLIRNEEINITNIHSLHEIKTTGKLLMSNIQKLLDNLNQKMATQNE